MLTNRFLMPMQDPFIVGADKAASRAPRPGAPPSQRRARRAERWAEATAAWIAGWEAASAYTQRLCSITPEELLGRGRAVEGVAQGPVESVERVEPPAPASCVPRPEHPVSDASGLRAAHPDAFALLASLSAYDFPETGDTAGLPASVDKPEVSKLRAGATCTPWQLGTGCFSTDVTFWRLDCGTERAYPPDLLYGNPSNLMSNSAGNARAEEGVPPCSGGTPEAFTLLDDDEMCNFMSHSAGNPHAEEGVRADARTQEVSNQLYTDVCRFLYHGPAKLFI